MLYDGLNRPIATDEKSIKEALLGDTVMVWFGELVITRNEEPEKIIIRDGNDPPIEFPLSEIDQAVKKFMSLYMEGW